MNLNQLFHFDINNWLWMILFRCLCAILTMRPSQWLILSPPSPRWLETSVMVTLPLLWPSLRQALSLDGGLAEASSFSFLLLFSFISFLSFRSSFYSILLLLPFFSILFHFLFFLSILSFISFFFFLSIIFFFFSVCSSFFQPRSLLVPSFVDLWACLQESCFHIRTAQVREKILNFSSFFFYHQFSHSFSIQLVWWDFVRTLQKLPSLGSTVHELFMWSVCVLRDMEDFVLEAALKCE